MTDFDLNNTQAFLLTDKDQSSSLEVTSIPLALYIHIPWCVKKCPYCDFNSHEMPHDMSINKFDDYVDALLLDAKSQQKLTQNRQISSIFIGGGTPSLLPIAQYRRLFSGLQACFDFSPDIEVTMEANPGTLEHAPFSEYLDVGINRLSIGVQSFDDNKLSDLGRIHQAEHAISAIKAARKSGFERVNVDLMHGLPNQSAAQALFDIQTAHDAGATHVSWYQLTVEPNTVFYRNQPILPDEDELATIEELGRDLLLQLGYQNYEVSAWAGRDDKPCRHNINYWQFGDYLAIGAGAHGKISTPSGIYRFSKSRLPKDYVGFNKTGDAPKMVNFEAIPQEELASEFMLNVLRLNSGTPWSMFSARTGLSFDNISNIVKRLVAKGLIIPDPNILKTTDLGARYLNQILREFL
ncbi:radical SAM family heme chaperone HemW [Psychrobacter ciconiae]|uniref:radical SAM family heme chaperone HemW n=1 Tax=Psychrobacter ciconiae TaxID=1553449 RepID=UPI0019180B8D|nr:radical SAM family heme chaperone HemW [Psychrobacter ciconiae]